MEFRRRQLLGWGLLAAAALGGVLWLLGLDHARKISTDPLDLIPAAERAPELALVRSLASQAEARTMLFELTAASGGPAPADAAGRFAAALAREPAFDAALAMNDTAVRDAMGRALFEQRFVFLFPLWLDAHAGATGTGEDISARLAREATAELGSFLATPEALAFQEIIPADPLLLMPGAVQRLQSGLGSVPGAGGEAATLAWARLAASPLTEAGQAPAFAAIARAEADVQAGFPGVRVAYTGVNQFAAASRARIERDVKWLNTLSLAAVLGVALVFIRQVHRGLHLVPVVLLSMLGAWVATTLVFDRVNLLIFVVGSLLTGVAIDYGFYLFMQPPAGPDEDYPAKVRRLAKPLLASCLTTVAGFALLLFSELPFIRQLGVFVGVGLVTALVVSVVYFGTVRNPYLEARPLAGGAALAPGRRRMARLILLLTWLAALPGLARLQWRDDIRDLEIPSAALQREAGRIRALFGQREERTVYLSYGETITEARASLARLEAWLKANGVDAAQAGGLGAIVPTAEALARAREFVARHPEFPDALRAELATAGYDVGEFAPFFAAYARHAGEAGAVDLETALPALQARLVGPAALLLHLGQPLNWFITVVSGAPAATPPPEIHATSAGQLQSLNHLFSRYRESALRLSAIGLAIVGAGVFLSYGWRDGARIFAIPCGACLGLFGWLGWLGVPLNLFHLLGAFLGVCLTHNYSIFSATSAYRREPPPVSVRLSALTTAASFGVLALSGIPVVRALGSTVALMVVVALLAIEFEHLAGLRGKS
jgi:predicted exporter